jgi:hypothetical protein
LKLATPSEVPSSGFISPYKLRLSCGGRPVIFPTCALWMDNLLVHLDWTSLQLRAWLEDSLKRWALHAMLRKIFLATCWLLHRCIVPSRPLLAVFFIIYLIIYQPCKLYLPIHILSYWYF